MTDRLLALLRERRCAVARGSLLEYCRMLWPDEVPAAHHRLMLEALQDIAEGRCKRLLITMPPGAAKTAYLVRFASWFRGRYPSADMIAASHTQELADKSARRLRNICLGDDWREVWSGVEVSSDSAAVNRWTTTAGGDMFACGVGGTIVGRRAMGFLGDDLSGGIADAIGSTVTRKFVWEWYQGDVLPRLKPGGWVAIAGTCFHAEDFIGQVRQMAENGVEDWRIINFPMVAEDDDILGRARGDILWPEYFTQDMVDIARRNNDTWMALYQQKPIVESGQYFKREWIQEYDKKPDNLVVYGASDYAVTHGGGDYTVHVVAGVDENDRLYLLDFWRGQTDPNVWIDELVRLAEKWKPLEWFEEKGQIARGLGSTITKSLRERKCYVYRTQHAMPRGADGLNSKQVGAQGIRGRMSQGMVYFPRGAWWMADMLSEMMAFPTEKSGVHDDTVDALALLGRALSKMVKPMKPKEPEQIRWQHNLTINELIERNRKRRLARLADA